MAEMLHSLSWSFLYLRKKKCQEFCRPSQRQKYWGNLPMILCHSRRCLEGAFCQTNPYNFNKVGQISIRQISKFIHWTNFEVPFGPLISANTRDDIGKPSFSPPGGYWYLVCYHARTKTNGSGFLFWWASTSSYGLAFRGGNFTLTSEKGEFCHIG